MRKFATTGFFAILLCLLLPALAFAGPLIANGSFEDVQITTPYSVNTADIPGWTHSGDPGDALLWNATFPQCCGGTGTAKAGDGNQFVTLGGGFFASGSEAWSQTITGLTIGQTYIISFDMAAEGETATQPITVGFTDGSATAAETFTSPVTNTLFWQNWGANQYSFVPTASSATLQFSVANQPYDVGLDAVSISSPTTTPEPGTLVMFGSGMVGLAGMLRRKLMR